MHEIKFRGKDIKTGEWRYGSLIQTPAKTYILEADYEVEFAEPEYHEQGMGCGLEDRGITDRYEAMYHGFECATNKCAENHPPFIEVDPETVGQYVNLKDKNGVEIYSGDIVGEEGVYHFLDRDGWEPNSGNWQIIGERTKNFTGKEEEGYIAGYKLQLVEWVEKSCGFEPFSDSQDNCGHCGGGEYPKAVEVISNVHDNPELLTT